MDPLNRVPENEAPPPPQIYGVSYRGLLNIRGGGGGGGGARGNFFL